LPALLLTDVCSVRSLKDHFKALLKKGGDNWDLAIIFKDNSKLKAELSLNGSLAFLLEERRVL